MLELGLLTNETYKYKMKIKRCISMEKDENKIIIILYKPSGCVLCVSAGKLCVCVRQRFHGI